MNCKTGVHVLINIHCEIITAKLINMLTYLSPYLAVCMYVCMCVCPEMPQILANFK